jgi:hypothetical protein
MNRKVTVSIFAFLMVAALACLAFGAEKSWTGVISDSHCGLKHSAPSDEAATCVASCIKRGAKYVLVSGGKLYQLTPQEKVAAALAGREAKITGSLSGDTITVTTATAAPVKKVR